MVLAFLDHVEAFRPWQVDGAQYKRIQNAEHHCVRRDSDRQRQNGDDAEAGALAHHPQSETHVLLKRFAEVDAGSFAAFLFESLIASELDACPALGFRLGQAGTFQIVCAVLEMRSQLVLHFAINP